MSSADKHIQTVVTGFGLVTPLGSSADAFYAALGSGACAITRDPAPNGSLYRFRNGTAGATAEHTPSPAAGPIPMLARVGDFGAAAAIEAGRRRRMPRIGQFSVVAAQQALGGSSPGGTAEKAQVDSPVLSHYGRARVGVVMGTGLGALDTTLEFTVQYIEAGLGAGSPALFPYTVMNTAGALVAMEFGLTGPNITLNHRDLSLAEAVATGCDLLRRGQLDAVLAGGGDELGAWLLHAYAELGVLPQNGKMCPYDRHRQGFCHGEGAVLFLLERADTAAARGAKVLARISGIGRSSDDRPRIGWQRPNQDLAAAAHHAAHSVTKSLAQAELEPAHIDFISGSGNGTVLDALETLALRQSLGKAAEQVPIASVLGQTGEWMTSAGVRIVAALYALSQQALPGTCCLEPDPAAALPGLCLRPQPAPTTVRHVLVPTFAQGGGNVSLVLSHP